MSGLSVSENFSTKFEKNGFLRAKNVQSVNFRTGQGDLRSERVLMVEMVNGAVSINSFKNYHS
jgi:hypothetical protein